MVSIPEVKWPANKRQQIPGLFIRFHDKSKPDISQEENHNPHESEANK